MVEAAEDVAFVAFVSESSELLPSSVPLNLLDASSVPLNLLSSLGLPYLLDASSVEVVSQVGA